MKHFKNTTEGRKQLLQYVLNKEMEKYKKIIFPYKRRPLLWNKVKIQQRWLTKLNAAGLYEWDEKKSIHSIKIDRNVINQIMRYHYNKEIYYCYNKKSKDNDLIQTIDHELFHAFINERFKGCCYKIKNPHLDASPIFLSYLTYFNIHSGHNAMDKFKYSNLYKKVIQYRKMEDYEDFENYMFDVGLKYNSIANKYYQIIDGNKKIFINNDFEFSSRKSGLYGVQRAAICSTRGKYLYKNDPHSELEDTFYKYRVEANSFEIGANISPGQFKKILDRKLNNENFEKHKKSKKYLMSTIKEIVIDNNWNNKIN